MSRRPVWTRLRAATSGDLIYQLSGAGQTVFVTTHYMEEAEYCNRLALMYAGRIIAMGEPADLKRTMYTHSLLQLDTSELVPTMKLLQGEAGILEVAVFGAGLHVTVADTEATVARIRGKLAAANIEIRKLESIPPSMEDLFVSLIESEERKGRMSFRRVRAVIRKEIKHILRDPRSLLMALAEPMLMLMLFGYALTLDVDKIPTLIYDQDHSAQSRALIEKFRSTRFFDVKGFVTGYSEIERGIDRNRIFMGIVIPRNYGSRVAGRSGRAMCSFCWTAATRIRLRSRWGTVRRWVRSYSLDLRKNSQNQHAGFKVDVPVDPRMRVWYNSTLESKNYVVPG